MYPRLFKPVHQARLSMNSLYQYIQEPFREYSDIDLLALLIGGDNEKAQQTARTIFEQLGSLKRISQLDAKTLHRFEGVGMATAVRIHAGLRAGRRALFYKPPTQYIQSPADAYEILWPLLIGQEHEQLWALYLDRQKRLLMQKKLTQGNDQFTIVDPKHIYQIALHVQASGIIIAHNHPSDDPTPSEQDIVITKRIAQAGVLLNIPLIDHIILGHDRFCSFINLGLLQSPSRNRLG